MLVIFSDKPLLQFSQYMTTRQYSHQKMPKKYYDVAVVMGGFSSMPVDSSFMQPNYNDNRGARLWEAIHLYDAGVVNKIMISGDASISIDKQGKTGVEEFLRYMQDMGIHEGDLILEQYAKNTRDNATMSIAILDSLGYTADKCILITSATHMKRSLACFETEGWKIDGYATNIYPKPHPKITDFIPNWKSLTDWHEVLNEWFGIIVYRIVGY